MCSLSPDQRNILNNEYVNGKYFVGFYKENYIIAWCLLCGVFLVFCYVGWLLFFPSCLAANISSMFYIFL